LINERIRFPQIRVIDENNGQLGVMQTRDALDLARDRDLDLIVVAPQAQPPVCRIMDYGKFKYEKSKREKDAHKKSASSEMKMVRLHPQTSEHDRQVLVRHSERFLRSGHKVRVICRFKGRENAHPEIGRAQLQSVSDALLEICTVEGLIAKQGRDMTMNLTPRPGVKPLPKEVKVGKGKNAREAAEAAEAAEEAEFQRLQQQVIDEVGGDEAAAIEAAQSANGDNELVNAAVAEAIAASAGKGVVSDRVTALDEGVVSDEAIADEAVEDAPQNTAHNTGVVEHSS
jgi:translation initiation factor IF-3